MKDNPNILPETGFIREKKLLSIYPISRSAWWAGIKEGRYPAPVALGKRSVGWKVEDIRTLIERVGGAK